MVAELGQRTLDDIVGHYFDGLQERVVHTSHKVELAIGMLGFILTREEQRSQVVVNFFNQTLQKLFLLTVLRNKVLMHCFSELVVQEEGPVIEY